jgi:hypothetical protein
MRQAELLSAEKCRDRVASVQSARICRKLIYPYRYMLKNNRPPRSIDSFPSFQHGLKLLPAAYMAHVHLKQVGITCINR